MKVFNAFQIVAAFVAWPFLIAYLQTAGFNGALAAFYASCALYLVAFCCMVASVVHSLEEFK